MFLCVSRFCCFVSGHDISKFTCSAECRVYSLRILFNATVKLNGTHSCLYLANASSAHLEHLRNVGFHTGRAASEFLIHASKFGHAGIKFNMTPNGEYQKNGPVRSWLCAASSVLEPQFRCREFCQFHWQQKQNRLKTFTHSQLPPVTHKTHKIFTFSRVLFKAQF